MFTRYVQKPVETPPTFLQKYFNLGSNERLQEFDESHCGAYCLLMTYLNDNGYKITSALLIDQSKNPETYDEYLC